MKLDAATEGLGLRCGEGHAAVDGGFVGGGGFGFDEAAEEFEEGRLLAACSGEQGAHGNGRSGRIIRGSIREGIRGRIQRGSPRGLVGGVCCRHGLILRRLGMWLGGMQGKWPG